MVPRPTDRDSRGIGGHDEETDALTLWIGGNILLLFNFDPAPFILLNLAFSTQAAYAAPLILLAGTNDIARNTGPQTLQMIAENIQAIVELAQAHGIKVILCSLTPISDYTRRKQTPQRPPRAPERGGDVDRRGPGLDSHARTRRTDVVHTSRVRLPPVDGRA